MTPEDTAALFTRSDGTFHFARWGRPLAPVVFGTDDVTLDVFKDSIRIAASLGNLDLVDTDPELGANVLIFFVSEWSELTSVPHLDRLLPDLPALLDRLAQAGANQYNSFRFDTDGSIKLCLIFLRLDDALAAVSAQVLATSQILRSLLLWSDNAFRKDSPIALVNDGAVAIPRPDLATLIRAAYDPILPPSSHDPAFAHRLSARAMLLGKEGVDVPN